MGPNTDAASDVLDALADPQRRQVLDALSDRQPPVSLGDLAEAVDGSGEAEGDPPSPTPDGGTRVAAGGAAAVPGGGLSTAATLYHVHLPKLDDAGVIAFDEEVKEVRDWDLDGLTGDGADDAAEP